MNTPLPHLRGLQIFDAVARHLSMSRASEELAVGQSAVSQQIRRLEDFLGCQLVDRNSKGTELTKSGKRLALRLRPAFAEIRAAVTELVENEKRPRGLSVVALGAFTFRWLIPRLSTFQVLHSDVDVQLIVASNLAELERSDVEVSIRCGNGTWPGHCANFLMSNEIFPVMSPRLCAGGNPPQKEDLTRHPWIHIDAEPRQREWRAWTSASGDPDIKGKGEIHVSSSIHATEAAIAGLGIALGHTPFVLDALRSRSLVAFSPAIPADEGDYYVVVQSALGDAEKVVAFREWLLAQDKNINQ